MKNSKLWGILSILLVFGLVFTACSDPTKDDPAEKVDAATPVIAVTAQPGTGTVNIGESITLSVTAVVSDGGTLTYQWYSNATDTNSDGTEILNATSVTYSPNSTTAGPPVYYYVVVTNTNNDATGEKTASVTSEAIRVVINDPGAAEFPEIQSQPQGGSFYRNEPVSLTVIAVGTGTLSYQWYNNGTASNEGGTLISGATSAVYPPSSATVGTYYYYVVVTNTESEPGKTPSRVSSDAVTITVVPSLAEVPVIGIQPQGGSYYRDDPVTLTVTAGAGAGTLSYQWFRNISATNVGGTEIQGATNASYSPTFTVDGSYYYYVIVTNTESDKESSNVISNVVTITVGGSNPFDSLSANLTVTVDSSTKGQFIRGVGGMSDQCFIYGNGSWTDRVTLADIQNMFGHGPQELGLNMYRLLMYPYLEEGIEYTGPKGALTPGSPTQGIVDDTTLYQPGPSGGSKSGTLAADQSDYYNIIKKINEMDGYVMICPWIIPLEFTLPRSGDGTKGGGTGGTTKVDPSKFNELADWYVAYIRNLVNHGAPIFALSVQNEPDQGVAYDGCVWTGDDQRDMIRILGPKLQAAGLKGYGGGRVWDKIWIATGENAGLPGVAGDAAINDTGPTGASQYVEIATRHLYGGMGPYNNGITAVADPTKGLQEIWQTEHCDTTGRSGANAALYNTMSGWSWVWHIANEVYDTFALNKESAFIWWTSKRFYGFIGEGDYTTTQGAVLPRGHVMAHFGKYVLNTNMVNVTVTGDFVSNEGISAGSGTTNLGATTLPVVVGTNLNPTAFTNGNSNNGGQNQPTTKVMAFEADDGSYISVVAFTATRNSGAGGQEAGYVRIDLPAGFTAASAELMRSNSSVKQKIEQVPMNSARTAAIIQLPRSEIVSVKFIRAQ
jgi:O-glycosyl hydrolase